MNLCRFWIWFHRWIAHSHKRNCWKLRGNPTCGLQTTLPGEVAHFTHHELNVLQWCGLTFCIVDPPGLLTNRTTNTNSCQLAKNERGTHQNLNSARAIPPVRTGSRLFDNHRLLSRLSFSNQAQKSKLLSCRSTLSSWTLPSTDLTVRSSAASSWALVASWI